MLSEKDRQEYKQGIYDLYCEVGTTKLIYYPIDQDIKDDLYNDSELVYGEPILLTGVISPLDPTTDVNPIPTMGSNIFNFDIPILSLELEKLDPYTMLKGKFEFDSVTYQILDVTPQGMFTDFYTTYKFKAQVL